VKISASAMVNKLQCLKNPKYRKL